MNIVIIEDSVPIRAHLRALLSQLEGGESIRIVGQAAGEQQAMCLIVHTQPDLVTLDLDLTDGSGLSVLKKIRATGSLAKVLILTNKQAPRYRELSFKYGANGFYDKTTQFDSMLEQIQRWLKSECIT